MTTDDRARIRAALEAATPGPWKHLFGDDPEDCPDGAMFAWEGVYDANEMNVEDASANCHLIANAPTWLASLLDALEEAEGSHMSCDRCDAAEARIQELLQTIRRLANDTPFPEEAQDALAQRGTLLAEVGTQRAEVARLQDRVRELEEERDAKAAIRFVTWSEARERVAALEQENARLRSENKALNGLHEDEEERAGKLEAQLNGMREALRLCLIALRPHHLYERTSDAGKAIEAAQDALTSDPPEPVAKPDPETEEKQMSYEAWGDDEELLVPEGCVNEEEADEAFRLGAQACREMMARFVEQGGDTVNAASIRANWHPSWGEDPGKLDGDIPEGR